MESIWKLARSERKKQRRKEFKQQQLILSAGKKINSLKAIAYCFLVSLAILSIYFNKFRLTKTKASIPIFSHDENSYKSSDLTPVRSLGGNARNNPLSLKLGDLPGYTGWGRPSSTTDPWYKVMFPDSTTPTVRLPYSMDIVCQNPDCRHLNAAFYIRAYGPTVLTGTILRTERYNSTVYKATFFFMEPGEYVVEVVLTFSHLPPIHELPMENEPAYEGYLLPEMPLLLTVQPSSTLDKQDQTLPICGFNELFESSLTSALEKGTWSLIDRVVSTGALPPPVNKHTFEGYQQGPQSLGIRMRYKPYGCRLPSMPELTREFSLLENIHVVFLGDSNTLYISHLFKAVFWNVTNVHFIKTYEGLNVRFPEIREAFQAWSQSAKPPAKFFLLFNVGLHEIARLCSKAYGQHRKTILSLQDGTFSCAEMYRKNLEELVNMTKSISWELKAFMSTPGIWLKYGNWGFSWSPTRIQEYPFDSHACGEFNKIAWDIMRKHQIPVIDSYWLSLSRPDHMQIYSTNDCERKLVHVGVEIYETLLQKWLTLIISAAKQAQTNV